ncbi:phist protein [Plasmodium ovale wallikeri]|uniref:Phist protein n=1 Tax=Plasmodium ovale wallikeri TaxID=864142 RepID=A0A1A8YM62_PLAOA|nr:phist protein [Plasmodium ovale wallikeri]SBT56147.1 phist protein [Plasmodium ovale wallikeri]
MCLLSQLRLLVFPLQSLFTYEGELTNMKPPVVRHSRKLSEVILRNLEKYIHLNDQKLLGMERHLRGPHVLDDKEVEEKIKSLREKYKKSEQSEQNENDKSDKSDKNGNRSENVNNDGVACSSGEETVGSSLNGIESELCYDITSCEELTDEEFNERISNLRGYIDMEEILLLWNYVYKNGKRKYMDLKEELWKICEDLSILYNVPEECTMKEWRKAYLYMKDELMKKERDDFIELKIFTEAEFNSRWEYIAFIIDKKQSWTVMQELMKDNWKNNLSKSFEKCIEEIQEKEMDKNIKTGIKVDYEIGCNDKNNILVEDALL